MPTRYNAPSRITSYNVCYTKLLRVDSLSYVPYSGGMKFEIASGNVSTQANVTVRVCEVKTPYEAYLKGMRNNFV